MFVPTCDFCPSPRPRLKRLLSESTQAMISFYFFLQFLAPLQSLVSSRHVVRAKVDQCLSLGSVSQIANCLDPFTVGHSFVFLRNIFSPDLQGTGEHLDHRVRVRACGAFFPATGGLLGRRSICSQCHRKWSSVHYRGIPVHSPQITAKFCRPSPGRRLVCFGGKHSFKWSPVRQRASACCFAKPLHELTACPHLSVPSAGRWSGASPSSCRLRAYRCKELALVN